MTDLKTPNYRFIFWIISLFLLIPNTLKAQNVNNCLQNYLYPKEYKKIIKRCGLKQDFNNPHIFFIQNSLWVLTVKYNDRYTVYQGLIRSRQFLTKDFPLEYAPISSLLEIGTDNNVLNDTITIHTSIRPTGPQRFTVIKDKEVFYWDYNYHCKYEDVINKNLLAFIYGVFDKNVIYLKIHKFRKIRIKRH